MAYRIVEDQCTSCSACESECPNSAISAAADGIFVIDATKCTECKDVADTPRCANICPVDSTCVPAD